MLYYAVWILMLFGESNNSVSWMHTDCAWSVLFCAYSEWNVESLVHGLFSTWRSIKPKYWNLSMVFIMCKFLHCNGEFEHDSLLYSSTCKADIYTCVTWLCYIMYSVKWTHKFMYGLDNARWNFNGKICKFSYLFTVHTNNPPLSTAVHYDCCRALQFRFH